MKEFLEYAPVIIIVAAFLLKNKIFVTPEQLEQRHREILRTIDDNKTKCESHCSNTFVTKEEMQIERKELLEAIDTKYIERTVYEEAQKRIDERLADNSRKLEKIANNQEALKDLIIQKFMKD